ncbi:hypothetical protein ACFRKE_27215 [Kitasatospora indigofera]|uniref:hypothetical protein n=1 Tax=Kitasatospora indigofera TaxID=67307 RepID=UPI0036AFEFC5
MLDHESIRGLRARTQALAGTVRDASAAAVVRRVSCTSSTPLDASSGNNVRHRLDTGGNRALNSVSTRS